MRIVSHCTLALAFLIGCTFSADAQTTSSTPPQTSDQIVVSATKLPEEDIDLPADTTVITGEELRARGVQTLADALATAKGVEAFEGSDQGGTVPNVSLWGLKEFDAYLVEVNGVPVGGTYDPDLQQIDVRDIEKIEIVRGPAGALYGSTAFAGVISITTRTPSVTRAEVAGGSFGFAEAHVSTGHSESGQSWSVSATANRQAGWRANTAGRTGNLSATWNSSHVGGGSLQSRFFVIDQREDYGAPLPVDSDSGLLPPGVTFQSNLALPGSEIASRDFGLTTRYDHPLIAALTLTNVFGYTHRDRHLARTFVDSNDLTTMIGAGTDFRPRYDDLFEDLRLEWAPAQHHLVAGTSVAYGSLGSSGRVLDFSYDLGGPIPSIGNIPGGTGIRLTDRRVFAGLYAEDEWTPTERITATGGVRYDRDIEHRTYADTDGNSSGQARHDGAFSGRAGVVVRLLKQPTASVRDFNFHVVFNQTFKPATFDPTPQSDEGLLAPERSHSIEAGFKLLGTRLWDVDVSAFDMHLANLVLPVNVNGVPTLINAGEDRFRGLELSTQIHPTDALTIRAGWAQHDPRFVRLVFAPAPGEVEDDSGHLAELVARHTLTTALIYSPRSGPGGSVTVQAVGPRALDRDNVYFTKSYVMVNASFFVPAGPARVELAGRNLLNKRFYTTDSELMDGLRYISAPRSVLARLSWTF